MIAVGKHARDPSPAPHPGAGRAGFHQPITDPGPPRRGSTTTPVTSSAAARVASVTCARAARIWIWWMSGPDPGSAYLFGGGVRSTGLLHVDFRPSSVRHQPLSVRRLETGSGSGPLVSRNSDPLAVRLPVLPAQVSRTYCPRCLAEDRLSGRGARRDGGCIRIGRPPASQACHSGHHEPSRTQVHRPVQEGWGQRGRRLARRDAGLPRVQKNPVEGRR